MTNTTQSFADAIGRKRIADAVGVGLTAVSNAVVRGSFPAAWFAACQGLADAAGVTFPLHLFQQRGLTGSHDVDASTTSDSGELSIPAGQE